MARPLQKTKKDDGTLYTRPAEIEAAIDAAVLQDLDVMLRRARIRDPKAADYLPSECLVHLIRDARRHNDERAQNALLPLLLARCAANLNVKVGKEIATADQLREEILGDFAELFAIDGSPEDRHALDIFEVRFNMSFQTFRITRVRPELLDINSRVSLPEDPVDFATVNAELGNEVLARVADLNGEPNPEEGVFRNRVIAAINALPPDERKAVILCHYFGFKEESDNPDEQTAATLCGVTGRTIRNRLARAIAKLSKLKEAA